VLIHRRIILVRSENASKTARQETEKQLRVLETAIQKHIELTKIQQDDALQRRKEIESLEDEDEEDDGQRILAIRETEEQSRLLEADQSASGVVSQILSTLSVPRGNTYSIDFSHSHNEGGLQIGHSAGTINWNGSRT
jgi:hypothetical protein